MSKKPWTPIHQHTEEIIGLWLSGQSHRHIAAQYGCVPNAVGMLLRRHGHGTGRGKVWSDEDRERCFRLRDEGHSYKAIGKQLGVSQWAVRSQLRRRAAPDKPVARVTAALPAVKGNIFDRLREML